MWLTIGVAALVLLSIGLPLLDRLTDAPIMRRDVNAGSKWWRLRERLRRREDPTWSMGSDVDDSADNVISAPRGPRHSRPRHSRN